MPRLRNIRTGAFVSCSHETAARLGSEWVSVDGSDSGKKPNDAPVIFTVAELKAQIDLINADRADDLKIVPASSKKADLIAALEADKASSAAAEVTIN